MGTSIVKYSMATDESTVDAAWGVLRDGSIFALSTSLEHHRDLMDWYFNSRQSFDAAIDSNAIDNRDVHYHSPISRNVQLFAQGLNYASHRAESGVSIGAEDEENLLFYKASSSIVGPNETIIRPKSCELLDYEIELGLAIKADIHSEISIKEADLKHYIGGLFLCNDVSARDFMFGAPMIQWFKGKSQRTFCPTGPVLYLMDDEDFKNLYKLELILKLNGEVKQKALTEQLIHKPAKTLSEISQFSDINNGDCILTGTPGGVLAGHSLKAGLAIILNFTNDKKRRQKFVAAQKAQAKFLQPGDKLELAIRSTDGNIDLGTQTNAIADA